MSVAAAIAVVLGTSGTYISGEIGAAAKSCDLHRELLLANGSPHLRAYRNLSPYITNGQAYLALAMSTKNVERRREYAYLGIAAANNAILATPGTPGKELPLFSYPSDKQLASYQHMAALTKKVYKLDIALLGPAVKAHDKNMQAELDDLAECGRYENLGDLFSVAAVLFTLISVGLIAVHEFYQREKIAAHSDCSPSAPMTQI